ncbi:DUF4169 family protein [Pseudoxanthobacter sp. M-2]|uniref:DUF4169 family protein n=1 Tax=Pseudoxanthobacter sp. M-2 TaxID=3078754 RepID=UPI0038FC3D89
MAEIVNLRLARKRKARDAAAEAAAQARAAHGLSKAEKTLARARAEKAERDVEAHRLDGPAIGSSPGPASGPTFGPSSEPSVGPSVGVASDRATGPSSVPPAPQPRDSGAPKPD